jgi:hypothetical protein
MVTIPPSGPGTALPRAEMLFYHAGNSAFSAELRAQDAIFDPEIDLGQVFDEGTMDFDAQAITRNRASPCGTGH